MNDELDRRLQELVEAVTAMAKCMAVIANELVDMGRADAAKQMDEYIMEGKDIDG